MLDLEVIRPIVQEIRQLRTRLDELEREHDQIVFDATGVHVSLDCHFADEEAKKVDFFDVQDEMAYKMLCQGWSKDDLAIIFPFADRGLDHRIWKVKAPQLYAILEKLPHTGRILWHYIDNDILSIEQAMDISDKNYLAINGVGLKTLSALRMALWKEHQHVSK